MAMGIELDLYKSKQDLPLYRSEPRTLLPDKARQEELQEAKQVAGSAASSSTQAPDPFKKEQVQREDKELKDMRAKAKNSLFLAGEILATEGLQDLTRMMCRMAKPAFDQHAQDASQLRSPEATKEWSLAAAQCKWVLEELWPVAQTLGDWEEALPYMGFISFLDPASKSKISLSSPEVLKDDCLAEKAWAVQLGILGHRARSLA
eukprot:9776703-Lingulodinium_polyedra.AAC.1